MPLPLLLVATLAVCPTPRVTATEIQVTATVDDLSANGNCTLREAIQAANTNVAVDACPAGSTADDVVRLPAGTYMLSLAGQDNDNQVGSLDIFADEGGLEIAGAGAEVTIVDADGEATGDAAFRIPFFISRVTMRDVTLRNGRSPGGGEGGGIENRFAQTLVLERVVIENNSAQLGGGLFQGPSGELIVRDSTLRANQARAQGGAIMNRGTLTVVNSTLSGNSSGGPGGALANDSDGDASLANATVTVNSVPHGVGGGGIFAVSGGTVRIKNTILAGNTDNTDTVVDCSGQLISQGYNLVENPTLFCDLQPDGTGPDLTGVAPGLQPLGANGGPTPTHALAPASAAIDAGNPTGCTDPDDVPLATDQRGFARPTDGDDDGVARCDIGAFEAPAQTSCVRSQTRLCIDDDAGDRRFEVEIAWNRDGASGMAGAIPLESIGVSQGGLFWIGSRANPEVLLKILKGCPVNGFFWVFYSAGTNQGLDITVRDTETGRIWTSSNPDGTLAPPVADTTAFACD